LRRKNKFEIKVPRGRAATIAWNREGCHPGKNIPVDDFMQAIFGTMANLPLGKIRGYKGGLNVLKEITTAKK
jgi:hypothetical protein